MKDEPKSGPEAKSRRRGKPVIAAAVLAALIVFSLIVMILNSGKPDFLNVEGANDKVKGSSFVRTNQAMIRDMESNWIPNDMFWPTIFLDNAPNFQIGELEVIRYNVRVLRDNLSRMRTTDKLDPDADAAFTSLSNDPYKWWFPSAESKWRQADKRLQVFHDNLASGKASFYPRADNLVELLNQYVSLMGGGEHPSNQCARRHPEGPDHRREQERQRRRGHAGGHRHPLVPGG